MRIKIIKEYDTVEVDREFDLEPMYAKSLIASGHAVAVDEHGNPIVKPEPVTLETPVDPVNEVEPAAPAAVTPDPETPITPVKEEVKSELTKKGVVKPVSKTKEKK